MNAFEGNFIFELFRKNSIFTENFDNILLLALIFFLIKEGGEDMITIFALIFLILS